MHCDPKFTASAVLMSMTTKRPLKYIESEIQITLLQ